MLRLVGDADSTALTVHGADKATQSAILPPPTAPPGIFVLGNPPEQTVTKDGFTLSYIADDPAWLAAHLRVADQIKGLRYFAKLAGRRARRELTVVWLGVDRRLGTLSGFAGDGVLLVNYLRPDGRMTAVDMLRPQFIVQHEQFHQVVRGTMPLWVSESLAQYYAGKAMRRIHPDDGNVDALISSITEPPTDMSVGLLEAQRRVLSEHDSSAYQLFYTEGAAFWHAVDEALEMATGGKKSLDDIVPLLTMADYGEEGALPPTILDAFRDIPAATLSGLFRKYGVARTSPN